MLIMPTEFEKHVERARLKGAKVYAPNGLPIQCIRHDGTLLEHEHADHPTYIRPVRVDWVGPVSEECYAEYKVVSGSDPTTEQDVRDYLGEVHALVYTDGNIAVTIYECNYAMWSIATGYGRGRFVNDNMRLSQADRDQISATVVKYGG